MLFRVLRYLDAGMQMKDHIMSWMVCLIPRRVCRWSLPHMQALEPFIGPWVIHILRRAIGDDAVSRCRKIGMDI